MDSGQAKAPDRDMTERLIATVATANAHMTFISAKLESLEKRLFGNGQPGELQSLQQKYEKQNDWITRADEREKTNRRWSALLGTAAGAVISAAYEWLAHKK